MLKKIVTLLSAACITSLCTQPSMATPQPKHFKKVLVVIFENMNYDMIKNEPVFSKLLTYTGHDYDRNGHLVALKTAMPIKDTRGNHYAIFTQYSNNHLGGDISVHPSQPNYIAMIGGSTFGVVDDERHDLTGDNLSLEMNDTGVSWKVYAESMPDPRPAENPFTSANSVNEMVYHHIKPYSRDPKLSEEQNGKRSHQYYLDQYKALKIQNSGLHRSGCFDEATHGIDGYARKHEPFISFTNVQQSRADCTKIVNSSHIFKDVNNLADVTFYIPNLKNDGHNGKDHDRERHANAFLAGMMGLDPASGEPVPGGEKAPFQQLMSQDGLLVITFDEPSSHHNEQHTIYTMLAGKMVKSGAYPDINGNQQPACYPTMNEQLQFPPDKNGVYYPSHCNHYNLLRMIEDNWSMRGLKPENTSTGYKYALPLGNGIEGFWS